MAIKETFNQQSEMTDEELEETLTNLVERGLLSKRWDSEKEDYVYTITEEGAAFCELLFSSDDVGFLQ